MNDKKSVKKSYKKFKIMLDNFANTLYTLIVA